MSSPARRTCFLVLLSGALLCALPAAAVSIKPAPATSWSPQRLVMEGIRTGNAQLLRFAWQRYEEAIRLHPQALEGYLMLGRVFFHLSLLGVATPDEGERAFTLAQEAVTRAPHDPLAHQTMGMVLTGRGRHLDAMESLKLAFQLNPTSEWVLADMATIHNALHEPDRTIQMLEGKTIREGWSYYVLAMAWLQKGDRGKAALNLLKARRTGFSGFWTDRALREIGLPGPR